MAGMNSHSHVAGAWSEEAGDRKSYRYSLHHMYMPEKDWTWQTQLAIETAKRKARAYFDRIRKDDRLWK